MADIRPTVIQFPDVSGESARDRLVRLVRFAAGQSWSLSNSKDKLAALVSRGVDEPVDYAVLWKTNCGTSALGFLALTAGTVDAATAIHSLLGTKSANGKSLMWMQKIGDDAGAWVKYTGASGPQPKAGDLMWYWNHPKKTNDAGEEVTVWDDHVEWCLAAPDGDSKADHGGGGRSDNAITVGNGDIRTNAARGMRQFLDLDKLNITPVATQPVPDGGTTAVDTPSDPTAMGGDADASGIDTDEQLMASNDSGNTAVDEPPPQDQENG
jgi:hypothetical protein